MDQWVNDKIHYLVLGCGGIRGRAISRCLEVLAQRTKLLNQTKGMAGASVGGLLAALLNCGYTPAETIELASNKALERFKKKSLPSLLSEGYGLNDGKEIEAYLREMIRNRIGNDAITLQEMHTRTGLELVLTGTCLLHFHTMILSYRTYPQMPLWKAMRITMGIPFFLPYVQVGSCICVDGGASCNIPSEVFPRDETLIILLSMGKPKPEVPVDIYSYMKLLYMYISYEYDQRERQVKLDGWPKQQLIDIETHNISSFSWQPKEEEQNLLDLVGRLAAVQFLERKPWPTGKNHMEPGQEISGDYLRSLMPERTPMDELVFTTIKERCQGQMEESARTGLYRCPFSVKSYITGLGTYNVEAVFKNLTEFWRRSPGLQVAIDPDLPNTMIIDWSGNPIEDPLPREEKEQLTKGGFTNDALAQIMQRSDPTERDVSLTVAPSQLPWRPGSLSHPLYLPPWMPIRDPRLQ